MFKLSGLMVARCKSDVAVEYSCAIIVMDDQLPSKDANPSRNPENDPTVTMTRVVTPAKYLAMGSA
jgi:hypothetical protein